MRPTLLLFVLLCVPAVGQTDVLTKPADSTKAIAATTPRDAAVPALTRVASPRIFDRQFFLLAGMVTTATVLDITTTSNCISGYSNCRETNPLLGPHPSSAKIYGVNLSLLAGEIFASAWLRHQMPHRKLWIIPPIVGTAAHGLAAALNVRTINQANSAR
jgi:hypothetical protein